MREASLGLNWKWQGASDEWRGSEKGSRIRGFKGLKVMLKSHKELKVWQKSYELSLRRYRLTARFPKEERYGLTSHMRRAVVPVSFQYEGYLRKQPLITLVCFISFMVPSVNWKHRYCWQGIWVLD